MFKLRNIKQIALGAAVGFLALLGGLEVAGATTFRIATLSPGGSFWMENFEQAADEVTKKTDGLVKFKFYPGGVMGSEQVVLRKMRIGQLQGAAVSSGALYSVYPELSLYSVPFLFNSQEQVSFVREEMDKVIKKGVREAGYVVPAIVGSGFAYIMSQQPVQKFEDLKQRKVWVPDSDQQTAENLRALGLNPIPLSLGDVLMGLETGLIDTIAAPPVVAIALQWHTRISYILRIPLMPIHGAIVLDKRPLSKLSDADQKTLMTVFKRTGQKIEAHNIEDNEEAIEALQKQGIEIIQPDAEARESWAKIEGRARQQALETSKIEKGLLKRVQTLADKYTSQKTNTANAQGQE